MHAEYPAALFHRDPLFQPAIKAMGGVGRIVGRGIVVDPADLSLQESCQNLFRKQFHT